MFIRINGKKYKVYEKNGVYFYYTRTKKQHNIENEDDIQREPQKPKKIRTNMKKLLAEYEKLEKQINELEQLHTNPNPNLEDLYRKLQECEDTKQRMSVDINNVNNMNQETLKRLVYRWINSNMIKTSVDEFERQYSNAPSKVEFLIRFLEAGIDTVVEINASMRNRIQELETNEDRIKTQLNDARQALSVMEEENGKLVKEVESLKGQNVDEIVRNRTEKVYIEMDALNTRLSGDIDILKRDLDKCNLDCQQEKLEIRESHRRNLEGYEMDKREYTQKCESDKDH